MIMTDADVKNLDDKRCVKRIVHEWEKDEVYENRLQEDIIKKIREIYGDNVWVFKTHDQCRVGIPDLIICFFGHFVAIELKRAKHPTTQFADRDLTPLQRYNLKQINKARGSGFVGRRVQNIIDRLNKIKDTLGIDM